MSAAETPTPLSPEELEQLRETTNWGPDSMVSATKWQVNRLLSTIDHYKALSTPVTPSLRSAAQQAANILFNIAQHSHQMDDTDKDLCRSVREDLDKALSTGRVEGAPTPTGLEFIAEVNKILEEWYGKNGARNRDCADAIVRLRAKRDAAIRITALEEAAKVVKSYGDGGASPIALIVSDIRALVSP